MMSARVIQPDQITAAITAKIAADSSVASHASRLTRS